MSYIENVIIKENEARLFTGYQAPYAYTIVAGTLGGGSLDNAKQRDKSHLIIDEDDVNGLEVVFDFQIPKNEKARRIELWGRYSGGADHYLDVYLWDWINSKWKEVSTLNNKDIHSSDIDQHLFWDFDLPEVTDAEGNVRVRFTHNAVTYDSSHSFYVDKIGVGDYKSQQLLADVNETMAAMLTKIANDYIEVESTGDTKYQLHDPRLRGADLDDVLVTADLTDDSDYQGVRVPVVSHFSSEMNNAWKVGKQGYGKSIKNVSADLSLDNATNLRIGYHVHLIQLDSNDFLLLVFVPKVGSAGNDHELVWKVLPENFTEEDANAIPFRKQTISSDFYLDLQDDYWFNCHYANSTFSNGKVIIAYEHRTSSGDVSLTRFDLSFDETNGFSDLARYTFSSLVSNSYRKHVALTQLSEKNGNGYMMGWLNKNSPSSYSLFLEDNDKVNNSSVIPVDIGTYYNGGGVAICEYRGQTSADVAVLLAYFPTSTQLKVLKVEMFAGVYLPTVTEMATLSYPDEPDDSNNDRFWMYSTDDGEVVISIIDWYDDYRDYFVSKDFGSTFTFYEDYTYSTDGYPIIGTDKCYYVYGLGGFTNSEDLGYFVSPYDTKKFAECKIDQNSLTIDFSKPPVKGTNFFVSEYLKRTLVIKNETTFDENGKSIYQPFVTTPYIDGKPIDANNQLEVEHTTNGRSRFSTSDSYNPETFMPRNHMFNVHTARIYDSTVPGWVDLNLIDKYPNTANGYPNGFNAAFYHGVNPSRTHGIYVSPKGNRTLYIRKIVLIVEVANKTDISLPLDSNGQTLQIDHNGNIFCDAVSLSDLMAMGGNLNQVLESIYTPSFYTYYIPIEAFPPGRVRNTTVEDSGLFEEYFSIQLSDGNQLVNDFMTKFYISFEMWETHTDKE